MLTVASLRKSFALIKSVWTIGMSPPSVAVYSDAPGSSAFSNPGVIAGRPMRTLPNRKRSGMTASTSPAFSKGDQALSVVALVFSYAGSSQCLPNAELRSGSTSNEDVPPLRPHIQIPIKGVGIVYIITEADPGDSGYAFSDVSLARYRDGEPAVTSLSSVRM